MGHVKVHFISPLRLNESRKSAVNGKGGKVSISLPSISRISMNKCSSHSSTVSSVHEIANVAKFFRVVAGWAVLGVGGQNPLVQMLHCHVGEEQASFHIIGEFAEVC